MRLILRWLIIMAALFVAAWLVPGIRVEGANAWITYGIMAAVLGLVNAIIRPILTMLSCGCIVATMGLFMLVINAFTLYLSSVIAQQFLNTSFIVENWTAAFLGGIIVSVVSFLLSIFLIDNHDK